MLILFYNSDESAPVVRQQLQAALPDIPIVTQEEIEPAQREQVRYAVAWNPPGDFFDGLTNLEAIFSMAAGVDHLINHPGLPAHVPLARLQDAGMGEKIAEYVLYGVLHSQRSFDVYREKQANGEWDRTDRDIHAADTRVGILGLGAIGSVVANRLLLNGYSVAGWSRTAKAVKGLEMFAGKDALPEFLGSLDVLVCLLPLTPETEGTIDSDFLALLPAGAFLINAARGKHVEAGALMASLESGHLRGALLDVTDPEPLPATDPLWSHPKILITPHVAGPTQLVETVEQTAANIQKAIAGEKLSGLVERDRGY